MIAGLTSRLALTFGADPMVLKESLGLSRRWQTYAFRALYVGGLALAVWLEWRNRPAQSGGDAYSAYSAFGHSLFRTFSIVQFFLIALLALSSGADMISKEVRGKTLEMLVATPLGPRQIVFGKWKSCLGYQAILLLSGVPFLSLGIYFGGVSGEQFLGVTILTFAAAAACTALGIALSSRLQDPYVAGIAGILIMASLAVYPFLCCLHPALVLFSLLDGNLQSSQSLWRYAWVTSSIYSLALAWLLLGMAAARVRRLASGDVPPKPIPLRPAAPPKSVWRRPLSFWLLADRPGVLDVNPHLWREMRTAGTGGLRIFTWVSLGGLVGPASLVIFVLTFEQGPRVIAIPFAILAGVIPLAAAAAGSGAFSREKEEKMWEVLLATPMTARQILGAKFVGAFTCLAPYGAALLVLTAWAAFALPDWNWMPFAVASLVSSAFIVTASLFFSLCAGTTRRARTLTLIMVFVLLAGVSPYESLMNATSPFAYVSGLTSGAEVWPALPALVIFYGAAGALILACMRVGFNRLAGRAR